VEELLFGRRYRAIEKVGSGGMADVYKAVDEVLGRTVAVKVMHARFAADPSFAARFRREAQAVANIVSPNIVNVYDWGQDDNAYYIVMEYVHGSDLKSIIALKGALPSGQVADIGAQVCCALSVAHGYDVIHRDIKPHNIMVQPDGAVRVMDFGIARIGNSTMTLTGEMLGTARYVSPEQAQGQPLTAASDLYSLGVVLYEAATGRLPFDGDSPVTVALKQVHEDAALPRAVNPDIVPGLEAVIVRAMQKHVADRYVSADDVRRDLNAIARNPLDIATTTRALLAAPAAHADDQMDVTTRLQRVDKTAVMPLVGGPDRRHAVKRRKAAAFQRRRPLSTWIVLASLLVVIGSGIAQGARLLSDQGGDAAGAPVAAAAVIPGMPVPDVQSMTRERAGVVLDDAGFAVGSITETYSDSVDAGMVVSQAPEPDTMSPGGSAVVLVISRGSALVSTPDIIGMSAGEAVTTLTNAGFLSQALAPELVDGLPEGVVIRQTPAHNELLARGSIVSYVLSDAPEARVKKHPWDKSRDDDDD